uniref:Thioredoxin domain-containing protein 3 n=1 Tax=Halisarca dujardinii TaxID=2583056 RepID=A0A9F1U409_HALDU|nr:thioredoxin domain-containing protein 3 [Halisarca dujardinii]
MPLQVSIGNSREKKMPGKKQIQLQEEVETNEDWKNLLSSKKGLLVVDVYSGWCGPCKAVLSLFRRLKNEMGDGLFFATAISDKISALEKYRDQSKPCFLFMATGGNLVRVVRGADGPLLESAVKEQLDREKKVLNGEGERTVIEDVALDEPDELLDSEPEEDENQVEEKVPTKKQYTVAIIKPDAVSAGIADEILSKMEASGMEVLLKEERTLSKEEAAKFYKQHEGSDHFEELVDFMTSGPSLTVVLSQGESGEGVVEEFRTLLGPTAVEEAKEQSPDSLRAQYGSGSWKNAVHGSDSSESAARELAFFFPKFIVPWVPGTEPPIQRTLAVIRPAAYAKYKEEILGKIHEAGFEIAMTKEVELSKEDAGHFYSEHREQDFFDSLTTHMSSGPFLVLALAREDAVEGWRDLLGPKVIEEAKEKAPDSLRSQFSEEGLEINPLHGSSDLEAASNELEFFFPTEQTVAVIKPNAFSERETIVKKIEEAGFSVSMSRETQLTKEQIEQLYSEHKDKDFFGDLSEFMSSGPSLFMVLSRAEAIQGWRAMMGPVDPSEAKEQEQASLRALFGVDKIQNAVHGTSSKEKAQELIKEFFGEPEPDQPQEVAGD